MREFSSTILLLLLLLIITISNGLTASQPIEMRVAMQWPPWRGRLPSFPIVYERDQRNTILLLLLIIIITISSIASYLDSLPLR